MSSAIYLSNNRINSPCWEKEGINMYCDHSGQRNVRHSAFIGGDGGLLAEVDIPHTFYNYINLPQAYIFYCCFWGTQTMSELHTLHEVFRVSMWLRSCCWCPKILFVPLLHWNSNQIKQYFFQLKLHCCCHLSIGNQTLSSYKMGYGGSIDSWWKSHL